MRLDVERTYRPASLEASLATTLFHSAESKDTETLHAQLLPDVLI